MGLLLFLAAAAGYFFLRPYPVGNPRKKHLFPFPLNPHTTLPSPPLPSSRTIVVGDVHGCLIELQAVLGKLGVDPDRDVVVFVGDLVNKGPSSAEVLRFIRLMKNAYSVRGNHDEAAVTVYCAGAPYPPKYAWLSQVSESDMSFLKELPYTITLPHHNATVVHACLDSRFPLSRQDPVVMTTARTFSDLNPPLPLPSPASAPSLPPPSWSASYSGSPFGTVLYGHDAVRGVNITRFAKGIDAGCCYGRDLAVYVFEHAGDTRGKLVCFERGKDLF